MASVNRRYFLGASAAALAAPLLRADDKKVAANDKIRVALVGCGGMGRANLHDFMRLPEFEIVGLCDPDLGHIQDAMNDVKKANRPTEQVKTESDFRKVVDRKDLDAVIVGTPDHWHCYVLIAACAANKDVYCEKPLSHNIVEGRTMVEAARRNKRVVQIGTQQRSGQHFKDAVKYVQDGKLGDVNLCRTFITNHNPTGFIGSPPDSDPPPGVDYDLWLGPAPKVAFNKNRFHHHFRWFWDYGNGLCNDWGVHLNDIILWAMKAKAPLAVYACGGKYQMQDNSDTPYTLDVHFTFPNFTLIYTVRQTVYHYGPKFVDGARHGMEFHGSKGILQLHRGGWVVTAEGDREKPEQHKGFDDHFGHVKNFLHCVHNRDEKTASDIEDMHRATTTCHLANISYKLGRRVYWDAEKERCHRGYDASAKKFTTEDADANALLLREPRKPWSLTI